MGWFTKDWYEVLGDAVDDENLNLYNGSLLVALTITVLGLAERLYEFKKGGNVSGTGSTGGTGGTSNGMLVVNNHFFDGIKASACMAGATIGGYLVTGFFLGIKSPELLSSGSRPDLHFMKLEDPTELLLEVGNDLN